MARAVKITIITKDDLMLGFTGPEDVEFIDFKFLDVEDNEVLLKTLKNLNFTKSDSDYLDSLDLESYNGPNPSCKGGNCD